MAWISQMKIVESRTVFSEGHGNGKAEREFTVSFAPGELKADDVAAIKMWCKQMSEACKCSIDEALPFENKPRTPEQGGKPAEPPKEPESATLKQIGYIKDLVAKKTKPSEVLEDLKEYFHVKDLTNLNAEQASEAITRLKEKK